MSKLVSKIRVRVKATLIATQTAITKIYQKVEKKKSITRIYAGKDFPSLSKNHPKSFVDNAFISKVLVRSFCCIVL